MSRANPDRPPQDERAKARSRVLHYLQSRERSRAEVQDRMRRYGYDDALIEELVAWLEQHGFLDQTRYAVSVARGRVAGGWSGRQVRAELLRKGVTVEEADEALARVRDERSGSLGLVDSAGEGPDVLECDEDPQLVALVARRFGRAFTDDQVAGERRAVSFLVRRGHDWSSARRVVGQAVSLTLYEGQG